MHVRSAGNKNQRVICNFSGPPKNCKSLFELICSD